MPEQKHTPGPLHVDDEFIFDSRGYRIADCACDGQDMKEGEADANSSLLAASYNAFDSAAARLNLNAVELAERMQDGGIADLITTLKDVQEWLADGMVDGVHFEEVAISEAVAAAIAKAEGRP